jgi:hypothetical protein
MHGSQGGNLGCLRDRWEGGPGAAVVIAVVALILVPILTGCSSGNTPHPSPLRGRLPRGRPCFASRRRRSGGAP